MDFIWAGERNKRNTRLVFSLNIKLKCNKLKLCAVDFYQVFVNDCLVSYGPERTASGYSRIREISLKNAKKLEIKVLAYNVDTFCCDMQLPFFGVELYDDDILKYESRDFICYEEENRIENMPRYSRQRGFVEFYDLTKDTKRYLNTYKVESPKILQGIGDVCKYNIDYFDKIKEDKFLGFDDIITPWWENIPEYKTRECDWNIFEKFINLLDDSYKSIEYKLKYIQTGFLCFNIIAKKETEVFAVFDEIKPKGKWLFRRSEDNDIVVLKLKKGENKIITAEPYALKYLKLICKDDIDAKIEMILLQNDCIKIIDKINDEKINQIVLAASNSFRQNAVDIFTDCSGRERAGWLCDSYFTAKAERFFTGENLIQKMFLENFLLAETKEIPSGMIPMCFPSEHPDGRYIPNWSLWFILQIYDYYLLTNDKNLIERAHKKIYDLLNFFEKFENEYNLLENLESWIFVEWSICNYPDYVAGVNFPSNMLYACALEKVSLLYNDKNLLNKSRTVKDNIIQLSFDGELFAENAIRENEKLIRCDNHLTETCQYYALFMETIKNKEFEQMMLKQFGPLRKEDVYPKVSRCNIFVGFYLRFFWLNRIGKKDIVMKEVSDYLFNMAQESGTLWEHDSPKASCVHGFPSSIVEIIFSK